MQKASGSFLLGSRIKRLGNFEKTSQYAGQDLRAFVQDDAHTIYPLIVDRQPIAVATKTLAVAISSHLIGNNIDSSTPTPNAATVRANQHRVCLTVIAPFAVVRPFAVRSLQHM